jgi:CheY-like chemotaxis protein
LSEIQRVLIVEDEPSDNQFLTLVVRGLGYAAESVFDGQAAVAAFQEKRPDLVLLDALLPKLDGFAVLQQLRQKWPDVPVLMMSGIYKKKSYEQEAVGNLGANAYLLKPLGVLQVWDLLEHHLHPATAETSAEFPGVPFWRRPLAAVVGDLWVGRKTGLLIVRSNGVSAVLFFEDGHVIFARSSDTQSRLDKILAASGKVRPEQLGRLGELAAMGRARLGELLVQEKLLTQDELREALCVQQRAHVSRPFTWQEGACTFFPTEAPRSETFKLPTDVPALVTWGCRQLQVDQNLIRFLPRSDRKIRMRNIDEALRQALGFGPDEQHLLGLLDGTRSVGQIRAIGRMLQLDVERLLAALLALQFIEVLEPPQAENAGRALGALVPVAGDLARFPPASLLVSMTYARKTGVVSFESTVQGHAVSRTVHLEEGRIAFATSSDPSDRLGQVLLRSGMLTREHLQAALAAAQATQGMALGRVLVAQGALTPDDLHRALVNQVLHVVMGLLTFRTGTFRFQEMESAPAEIVPLGLDTRQALLDAHRTCPFADLAPLLPLAATRLRGSSAPELIADLPLTDFERTLRDRCDGVLTVQALAGTCPEGPEAALRAIQALLSVGVIDGFLPRDEAARVPPPLRPVTSAPTPVLALSDEPAQLFASRTSGFDETFEPEEPVAEVSRPALFSDDAASFASIDADTDTLAVQAAQSAEAMRAPTWSTRHVAEPADAGFLFADIGAEPGDEPAPVVEGVAARRETAPCVALAEMPTAWSEAETAALCEFLARLGDWLRTCPEAVPESVRAALPPDLRSTFGV